MIFYYQLINENNEFLGLATTYDLRYYNEISDSILCCNETLAQFIIFEDKLYRVHLFQEEPKQLKNKYPSVSVKLSTQAEYEKYMEEKEKAFSDEK